MFLPDFHTHTRFSPDSEALAQDMALAAKGAGMDALCLTDHLDFLDFQGNFAGLGGHTLPFYSPQELPALAPPGLKLYSGVELGEPWADPALADRVAACPGLDFILGSAHNLDSDHGGQDFYFFHYDSEETCHEILDAYVGRLEVLSAMPCFDSLAHVIYPLRYMNGRDGNHVSLKPYYPRLEKVFRTLAKQGRSLEFNTTRGGQVEPWRPILALYKDCGGELVTLGSDAHTPQDVGKGIEGGAALIREYGLRLAVYEKRQPKPVTL